MFNKLKHAVTYICKKIIQGVVIMANNINDAKCALAKTVEVGTNVASEMYKTKCEVEIKKLDMVREGVIGLKNTGSSVCTGLKNTSSSVCTGLKNTGSSVCTGLKNTGSSVCTGLKNTGSSVCTGLKNINLRNLGVAFIFAGIGCISVYELDKRDEKQEV